MYQRAFRKALWLYTKEMRHAVASGVPELPAAHAVSFPLGCSQTTFPVPTTAFYLLQSHQANAQDTPLFLGELEWNCKLSQPFVLCFK